jgi:hypothetical protein
VAETDGWTPLLFATHNNLLAAAKILLEYGADPTLASKSGRTPLSEARGIGESEMIAELEDALAETEDDATPAEAALVDSVLDEAIAERKVVRGIDDANNERLDAEEEKRRDEFLAAQKQKKKTPDAAKAQPDNTLFGGLFGSK